MIIPVQIYNYFKGYIVSNKLHNKSGTMGGNVPIRLIDIEGFEKFYNDNNPMHENDSLLNHFTNAWLHISAADVLKMLEGSVGIVRSTDPNSISVRRIGYGDIMIIDVVMPIYNRDRYLDKMNIIFKRSIAILGYYMIDRQLGIIPVKEINIGAYEDWCYLDDNSIRGVDVFSW